MVSAVDKSKIAFAGVAYIGKDGIERRISDISGLVAAAKAGEITRSSLLRTAQDKPWRPAETDPSVAALLTTVPPFGAAPGTRSTAKRAAIIVLKTIFLVIAFVFAIGVAGIVGQLNADAWSDLLGFKVITRPVFPVSWLVFIPAVLAVKSRTFSIGGKAARFALSLAVAIATVVMTGLATGLVLAILPPLGPWPIIAVAGALSVLGWMPFVYAMKRIWALPDVSYVFRFFRKHPVESHSAQKTGPAVSDVSGSDVKVWRTFVRHEPAVQQAVERLAALSPTNVAVFRKLLVAGRDRARIKEYETASIVRVQGAEFVGDEDLHKAHIALNRQDPRLADELVHVVDTLGRPHDLDKAVAQILDDGKHLPAPTFETFWRIYPNGGSNRGKHTARMNFNHAVRMGADPGAIVVAAVRFAAYVASKPIELEDRTVPSAGSWLSYEEWRAKEPADSLWLSRSNPGKRAPFARVGYD